MSLSKGKKTILFADDDLFLIRDLIDCLESNRYRVITATTGSAVLEEVDRRKGAIDLAILDVRMKWARRPANLESDMLTGVTVARRLKKKYPNIKLIGLSVVRDASVVEWFTDNGNGYLKKPVSQERFLDSVHYAIYGKPRRKPRCFVVHGRDERTLRQLRRLLKNDLHIRDIIVLREQPNLGRTIIEKFENHASTVDVAFVLLTPDDTGYANGILKDKKRRARQNVIFELGYFYAHLTRTEGKVILLHKGQLDLPSDISGIVYIDISDGFGNVKGILRSELKQWF